MLSKLLKYDFRSLRRFGLPLVGVLAAVILLGSGNEMLTVYAGARASAEGAPAIWGVLMVLCMLFSALVNFLLSAAATAILILILVDFYQSLATDQGYLTFTLPVRSRDILLSKMISGGTWYLIVMVVLVAGMGLMGLVSSASAAIAGDTFVNFSQIWTELLDVIGQGFAEIMDPVDYVILPIILVLLVPVSILNSLLLYEMAIFFASVVSKKNKVLVAIASIFGVNFLYSIVAGVIILIITLLSGIIGALAEDVILMAEVFAGTILLLLAGSGVGFFFLTKYMMDKKLNLP
jgi:hypothetical protein